MQNQFTSIEDIMAFVASTDLGNARLTSMNDILAYTARMARLNETEVSATRSLVTRQLDEQATNSTLTSATPAASDGATSGESNTGPATVIGIVLAGVLALALLGCLVFAVQKVIRGEPVFSMSGSKKEKDGDVESDAGSDDLLPGPGAGRFYL
jgi:hypothetical protein